LDVKVWIHTDAIERYWDIYALIVDYSLQGRVFITTMNFSDEQMASMYSACDVTLGIGLGEGWGLPLAESLACGTPVVHGNYAGGAEFLPDSFLVAADGWRYEGPYCNKRPIFNPEKWADKIQEIAGVETSVPDYIKWENAWNSWSDWLKHGIE
jgi:glycosyltransferase involved in cell wall biosynthesis